jgi:hypothetical protein
MKGLIMFMTCILYGLVLGIGWCWLKGYPPNERDSWFVIGFAVLAALASAYLAGPYNPTVPPA